MREVMMAKRLEGSESLISFFVTANSLIVAGVYEGLLLNSLLEKG